MSSDCEPQPSIRIQGIPHVMESIFENLSNRNLFKCRLVRKSWAQEAGRVVGKRLDKNECTFDALNALMETQEGSDIGIDLKKVLILVLIGYSINDSPIRVYDTVTSLDLVCSSSIVPSFIALLFPNLQSLYIRNTYGFTRFHTNLMEASLAWSLELGSLPKLLKLRLGSTILDLGGYWKSFVETLLGKAVKLESFVVDYNVGANITATYIDKVCSRSLKSIKLYSVQHALPYFTALSVHPIHFPLETIDLQCIYSDTINTENIKLLLTRYSSTLRHLVLEFIRTFEMDFPLGVLMTNLCTLKIRNLRGSLKWSELPQLKKLLLYRSYFEGIASSITLAPQFCHLQAFTVFHPLDEREDFIRSFVDASEYLGRTLQTLHLVIACAKHLLPVICTKLTKLNRLTLAELWRRTELITDHDLCGAESLMFTPPVETLSGPPLNEFYRNLIASAKESNHARGPNITNLKDLQFLILEGAFSEVSVLHEIVHCEKLRELILFSEMTRDSVVHLVLNADLKHLTRMEFNGERINHLNFVPCVHPTPYAAISPNSILKTLEMF